MTAAIRPFASVRTDPQQRTRRELAVQALSRWPREDLARPEALDRICLAWGLDVDTGRQLLTEERRRSR